MVPETGWYIREVREGELDAVRAVTLAAYEQYAAVIPPPFWEGYRANILQALQDVGLAECIVAQYQGKIVGSVLLYPPAAGAYGGGGGENASADYPEVRLLAVDPRLRGQGIGRALMDECIARAQRSGAAFLGLHTADIMQTAMRMYERMGFVRMPELDFHPSKDVVIKGYRLDLAASNRKSGV